MLANRCTPERIDNLRENEVFVFGAKPNGHHKSGAALFATEKFGAIEGKAEGMSGQSYAIPVHRHRTEIMAEAVSRFVEYARAHAELMFYVLPIGCGAAGMEVGVVAHMFKDAVELNNVYLPSMFIRALRRSIVIPDNESLPIKYVDEIINADCIRGRMIGLMAEISKRTEQPITFDDEILKKDNIFLFAFLRIAKVVRKEEQRVMNALLDEAKRMSETEQGKESDNGTVRALELMCGWKLEANKIFEEGGTMYDLLTFTNPQYIQSTHEKLSKKGSHEKLADGELKVFSDEGKYGLKNSEEKVVIPAEYDEIKSAGWSGRGWHLRKNERWGAVNERGEWMFDVKYDRIKVRYEGGHFLTRDGKMGFCDSKGILTIDFLYDELENYSSYEGAKAKIYGNWGYVDGKGNVVVPIQYDSIDIRVGMICVKKDAKYGFYDITGKLVIPVEYDNVGSFTSSHPKEATVKKDGTWGVIANNGSIILPIEYESVSIDAENVYRVKKNGLYGIIDKDGKVLFPFKYQDLGAFDKDCLTFAMNEEHRYGYIDRDDHVIIGFSFERAGNFNGKYAEVSMGWNKTGLIDKTGKVVIPMKYTYIRTLLDDTAEIVMEDRNEYKDLYGIYDLKNNYCIPCRYERIEPLGRNRDGIMECRCWQHRDSDPIVLKVNSQGNSRTLQFASKEIYFIKLSRLSNGQYEILDIRKDKNDNNYLWIEIESINQVLTLPKSVGSEEIIGLTSFGCWTDRSPIKGLVVPEGYKYIGGEAFMAHPTLEFVSLPDGLRKIEQAAFTHCANLKHVFLGRPSGLLFLSHPTSIIENMAFDECHPSLTFYVPERYIGRTYDRNRFQHVDLRERNEQRIIASYMEQDTTLAVNTGGRIAIARDFAITLEENEWELNLIGHNPDFRQLCRSTKRTFVKLAAGFDGYMALTDGGQVIAGPRAREFERGMEIEQLHNVADVVSCEGHTVALHSDGSVTCIDEPGGYEGPDSFAHEVSRWHDIVQIACGFDFVAGLKSDGTLISTGRYYHCPSWRNVVQFDAFNCYYGQSYTIGILADGSVVTDYTDEVSRWRNIVKVRMGNNGYAVGLKSDGTAYALGPDDFIHDVQSWRNIVDIECKFDKAVAIISDGRVLTTGFH